MRPAIFISKPWNFNEKHEKNFDFVGFIIRNRSTVRELLTRKIAAVGVGFPGNFNRIPLNRKSNAVELILVCSTLFVFVLFRFFY